MCIHSWRNATAKRSGGNGIRGENRCLFRTPGRRSRSRSAPRVASSTSGSGAEHIGYRRCGRCDASGRSCAPGRAGALGADDPMRRAPPLLPSPTIYTCLARKSGTGRRVANNSGEYRRPQRRADTGRSCDAPLTECGICRHGESLTTSSRENARTSPATMVVPQRSASPPGWRRRI
jgi:hypothetical protein